jgi:hypothetical protein
MVDAAKKHPAVLLGGTAAVIVLIMIRSVGSKTTAGASGVYAMMSDPTAVAANTQLVLAQDALSANGATLAAQVQMNADNNAAALANAQITGNINSQYIGAMEDVTNQQTTGAVVVAQGQTSAAQAVAQGQTSAAQAVALAQTAGAVAVAQDQTAASTSADLNATLLNTLSLANASGNQTLISTMQTQGLAFLGAKNGVAVQMPTSTDYAASDLLTQFGQGAITSDQLTQQLASLGK